MKKQFRKLKHFFLPHKGNRYKPGIFARESVAVLALVLIVVEAAYLIDGDVFLKNAGFTAAVLPAALTDLTNSDREAQGLSALTRDPILDEVAQAKADDMASKGYFAHIAPDGTTPWDMLKRFDYPYTYAGENLAVDFDESQDVETAWMNSPAHRANILKPEYEYVGYGVAQGTYEGHTATFVAEYFAAKAAASTPVASAKPTTPAPAPTSVPATAVASTQTSDVLGAATQPTPQVTPTPKAPAAPSALTSYLASPRQFTFDFIVGLTALIGALLALSLFFHIRKRYLHYELLVGGAVLVALGYSIMALNLSTISPVSVPSADQSASVSAAF